MPEAKHDTRTYLDANATTPPLPEVVAAVTEALETTWGNPSSQHAEGRAARRVVEAARDELAALLDVPAGWITWTSGGTEAINLWLQGRALALRDHRPPPLLWISAGEHPAVRETALALAARGLAEVVELPTTPGGRLLPERLAEALAAAPAARPRIGVAVIGAHNETGVLQEITALAAVAAEHAVPLFVDGVQWTGKLPATIADWSLAGWSVSFHKFGGPKGVGALVAPPEVVGERLLGGGGQERRRRPGTHNVPGIAGAGRAAQLARTEGERWRERWRDALDLLARELPRCWPGAAILAADEPRLPQTALLHLPGTVGVALAQRLDLEGISVSTGSACASGAVKPSEVLQRLGVPLETARAVVRVSLAPRQGVEAIHHLLEVLERLAPR